MKLKTFNTLKKIMQQTVTDNDAVALQAIRAANKILATEGITWERVFTRLVTVQNDSEVEENPDLARHQAEQRPAARASGKPKVRSPEDERIESIVILAEEAAEHQSQGTREFVEDVRRHWDEKGWLSKKQIDKLREVANR